MKVLLFVFLAGFVFFGCNRNKNQAENQARVIDYDFTYADFDQISAATFEMIIEPEKYRDTTVKIAGQFKTEIHEGKRIYAVQVQDEDGCCPAGMSFIPPENLMYPEDFPKQDQYLMVTGILKTTESDDELVYFADDLEF